MSNIEIYTRSLRISTRIVSVRDLWSSAIQQTLEITGTDQLTVAHVVR
jgi:hypothetical protein